jgi:hypothetical protein
MKNNPVRPYNISLYSILFIKLVAIRLLKIIVLQKFIKKTNFFRTIMTEDMFSAAFHRLNSLVAAYAGLCYNTS